MDAGPNQLMVAAWNLMWMSCWESHLGKGDKIASGTYHGHEVEGLAACWPRAYHPPQGWEETISDLSLKAWAGVLEVLKVISLLSFEVS